jgi:alanyl-tRNA synthetase/misacylated tRNA(Ala) deacylase
VKGQLWEVQLEDTVIFPEGGGQPFDTGRLVIDVEGSQEEFIVEGCLRKNLESVHLVRVPEGKEGALQAAVGGMGEVKVDWERRMDHVCLS